MHNAITQIFRSFGHDYIKRFGDAMPYEHHKVIDAIINCRTDAYGVALYRCEACGQTHRVFRSCGNRHCPACQNHKAKLWLQKQLSRQLPGHHFLATFTVPEQLRAFIRSDQRIGYAALFKASSLSLKRLAADPKYLGGDLPGFWGILHTWGRNLHYHPHIHYVIPGGVLSKNILRWHPARFDFFVPVKALSIIFRAKFRDEIKKSGLFNAIDPAVWKSAWNVNIQPVGTAQASTKYLGRYVFKVAITNSRIVSVNNRTVTFRYKKTNSNRWRSMSLDVFEFMRRYLQHILPTGFMKVRYYGFMNPNCSVPLQTVATLIEMAFGFKAPLIEVDFEPLLPLCCPSCGGNLTYLRSILPCGIQILADTG